jgi:hypothetical protein
MPVNRPSATVLAATVLVATLGAAACRPAGDAGSVSPGPSPNPSAVASPSPSTKPEPVVAVPKAIRGDWHAEVDELAGITSQPQPIRVAFEWGEGRSAWLQLDGEGSQLLQSSPLAAADGEIRLRADRGSVACNTGEIGHYRWSRSDDGLFLTFELVEDACAARGMALARAWVHSLSAVNDGGLGVVPGDPWMQVELPHKAFAMSGGTDAADVHTYDRTVPFNSLLELKSPMGYRAPCEADMQPFAIEPTAQAFGDYLLTLPGLQVERAETTIDGHDALAFEVEAMTEVECPTGQVGIFRSRVPSETEATWAYGPGDQFFLRALERDGSLYVLSWDGEGQTADDAGAIFDSIRFLDSLPTP